MKKFLLLFTISCCFSALTTSVFAAWCGDSFITFNGLWCTGSNSYEHEGGFFQGKDLGIMTADFTLGGELSVWPASDDPAEIWYMIDKNSDLMGSASMPKTSVSGENSKHQTANGASGGVTVSIAGLAAGTHTVDVWFKHGTDYDNNGGANFVATFTIPALPTVELTVPANAYIDEPINLSVSSLNVTDPVYTYSVKTPVGQDYVAFTTNPYVVEDGTGTYSFKVEVASENDPSDILAEDIKGVLVKAVPEPIEIKTRVPSGWGPTISFYNWNSFVGGNFVTAIAENDWYKYTFERMEDVSLIFVNGSGFTGNDNQTADITGITESTCFEVSTETDADGKRKYTSVDCQTFTGITQTTDNTVTITSSDNAIKVQFDGIAKIKVYSIDGFMVDEVETKDEAVFNGLNSGVYIVRVNDDVSKVLVR